MHVENLVNFNYTAGLISLFYFVTGGIGGIIGFGKKHFWVQTFLKDLSLTPKLVVSYKLMEMPFYTQKILCCIFHSSKEIECFF